MTDGLQQFCGEQFWDQSQLDSPRIPSLTPCFHYTVLVWVPALFFWLLFPIFMAQQVIYQRKKRFYPLPFSKLVILKMALTVVSIISALLAFVAYFNDKSAAEVYFWYPLVRLVTMAGFLFAQYMCRRTGVVSSGVLFNTLLLHLVCALPELYAWLERLGGQHDGLTALHSGRRLLLFAVWFGALGAQWLAQFWADPRSGAERRRADTADAAQSHELDASFANRLVLWWLNDLTRIGAKRTLAMDDLYQLNPEMRSDYLVDLFESIWTPKLQKFYEKKRRLLMEGTTTKLLNGSTKNGDLNDKLSHCKGGAEARACPRPSVVLTLFRMFKFEFAAAAGVKAVADVLQFANPFLLRELIQFVSRPDGHLWQGVGYALLMFAASELRSLLINWYFYIMFRMGAKIQAALTGAVYRKTLRLSSTARRDRTVGQIVNVMAIDCDRFQMITSQIQQYWSSPFQVTLALVFLFNTLGISALSGVVIMVIFLPLSIVSSVISRRYMHRQMKLKDQRTKMINEILNGIKVGPCAFVFTTRAQVIKLYAWEQPMIDAIERIRQLELKCVMRAGLIKNILDTFNFASPFLVALGAFATYTLISAEHALTPEVAFVSLTLFNQLRSPMTMIGLLINMTVSALVSNKRLKDLLTAEEVDQHAVERDADPKSGPEAVQVQDADFGWEPGAEPALSDVSLEAKRGQLIAVVGRVGGGKSSLLAALLGEMEKLKGRVGVRGRAAYVPQQAWIQNMSLQDNITFGRDFSRFYYNRVVEACALKADLDMLPHGDATEIGEKGINLSGGQKARVSLARAVYQNSDLYLLDDPLSAVDAHVGKHIFDKVIGPRGLLRNKTRILVTHGVAFLKDADLIVHIEDGRIAEMGTYAELRAGHLFDVVSEAKKSPDAASTHSDDPLSPKTGRTAREMGDFDDSSLSVMDDQDLESAVALERQLSTISSLNRRALLSQAERARPRTASTRAHAAEDGSEEKLIQKESLETGRVKFVVYWLYVKAASVPLSVLFAALFFSYAGLQLGRSLWLSAWSDDNDRARTYPNQTTTPLATRLGVYAGLGFAECLAFSISLLCLLLGGLRASRNLHSPVLERILHAPMAFFDTTPSGRILNRFGKDVDVCDINLPMNFRFFLMTITQVVSTMVAISLSTPVFILAAVPLCVVYAYALKYYVPTSRQLKRLESVHRSPIYSHFAESIQGAQTIRAFGKAADFTRVNGALVDSFLRIRNLSFVANRWLGIRLELIGNLVTFSAALFAALSHQFGFVQSAGLVGVSVSYALNITEVLNFAVRQISELETNIVSVERLQEYSQVETEAPWVLAESRPPAGWPSAGRVEFRDYATRYRPGLELVVRDISADLPPAHKVGIVGRTGAGKSSLTLALFRMLEPARGAVLIDGLDVARIGLHDLRANLTIIPQEPVLFSGTLRFNLDPFNKYTDDELWLALEHAHLKPFATQLAQGLEHRITEGGENISVGQRQLVCLARALLRKSRILVLDEATAAVDLATDALIQETIRREFAHATVLTIAHRLNTILDYDRVLVLSQGRVAESGAPHALLAERGSAFAAMAADANLLPATPASH